MENTTENPDIGIRERRADFMACLAERFDVTGGDRLPHESVSVVDIMSAVATQLTTQMRG
jgi:hypothetical protein